MNKVKAGATYIFDPAPWDRIDPPVGVRQGKLHKGDKVTVVNLPGCPRANTMGHCHIKLARDGEFVGLVSVQSLEKVKP